MSRQRVIDVRRQKQLTLAKCVRLVLSGITHRLLRSLLTTSVVLLAVAFFMAMLCEGLFQRSAAGGVRLELERDREASRFIAFIGSTPSSLEMSAALARVSLEPRKAAEYARVAGVESRSLARLADLCGREQAYLAWFEHMGVGKKLILVGKAQGRDIFRLLAAPTAWQGFLLHLEPLRSLKLPDEEERFHAFVRGYDGFLEQLDEFTRVWAGRIDALRRRLAVITGSRALETWLVTAPPADLRRWRREVAAAGFDLPPAKFDRIIRAMRVVALRDRVAAALSRPDIKRAWRKEFPWRMTLEQKLARMDDARALAVMGRLFATDRLRRVARASRREQRLQGLETALAGRIDEQSGSILSGRQVFLLVISFVVCMVGIANAMLMAITERFREIATMKCLGATDGYVLAQFMLEACLQGLAGGACGMLLGLLLALGKNGLLLGAYLLRYFPAVEVAVAGACSIILGAVLAALASIYPSWAASRMAPMEAMRVE